MRQSSNGDVNETAANREEIVYRAYLVDGPGHLAHDMVAAWADLPSDQPTGQVSGTVTDAATGKPLSNLAVTAAGLRAQTDADGHFVIAGLPQGLHNVLVNSTDGSYKPFQQGALVAANSETPASIALSPSQMATVTFKVTPPEDHTAGTPVFLSGNLDELASRPLLVTQADGSYSITMQIPAAADIRYKYTLGDGLWNAEHVAEGDFSVRQLILPEGTTDLEIDDRVASWAAGSSAPIWFELTAPADSLLAYIQFKLGEWSKPLPMWPLGDGHWAYKLNSPTNFAEPLEYRYCLDAACSVLEATPGNTRTVVANQQSLQQIQDEIKSWQSQ